MGDHTVKHTGHPAPLSEGEISKLRAKAGISGEKYHFIRNFLGICAMMYGIMEMKDCWDVYTELKDIGEELPKIHRADLGRAVEILRYEGAMNFRIYTPDEWNGLQGMESRWPTWYLLNEDFFFVGEEWKEKADSIRHEAESQDSWYISDDTDFMDTGKPESEKALLKLLKNLRVTKGFIPMNGSLVNVAHEDIRLGDFPWMTEEERQLVNNYRYGMNGFLKDELRAEEMEKRFLKKSAAEWALREFRFHLQMEEAGQVELCVRRFLSLLKDRMMADISKEMEIKLVREAVELSNALHRWKKKGESPLDSGEGLCSFIPEKDGYRLEIKEARYPEEEYDEDYDDDENEDEKYKDDPELMAECMKEWKNRNEFSYPAPLEDEELKNLARKKKVTRKALRFLEFYFSAAAYVFGALTVRRSWEIYKLVRQEDWNVEIPEVHFTDFRDSLEIFRHTEKSDFRILTEKELAGRGVKHDSWGNWTLVNYGMIREGYHWRAAANYFMKRTRGYDSIYLPIEFMSDELYAFYKPHWVEVMSHFRVK